MDQRQKLAGFVMNSISWLFKDNGNGIFGFPDHLFHLQIIIMRTWGGSGRFFLPGFFEKAESQLPLLEDRLGVTDETLIYVCFKKTCQLPVKTVKEALAQLNPPATNASNPFPILA